MYIIQSTPANSGLTRVPDNLRLLFIVTFAVLSWCSPARAQFKIDQSFSTATAPGWTLSGSALLTAPSIDADGSGWLRLTDATNNDVGTALYVAGSFASSQPIVLQFSFVAWGGTGADGISLFLYDSSQDMSGAQQGGGLGYCGGAGGYLAIGLDEYGNFSYPFYSCQMGGGPGRTPESLVIRGPLSANNPYVTGAQIAGGLDNPGVRTRPAAKSVMLTMIPATVGYTISVAYSPTFGSPYQTLLSNVSFPYAAPANLSVGFSGGTGILTNIHEIQAAVVSTPADIQLTATGPTQIAPGNTIAYTVTLSNNGPAAVSATPGPTLTDTLPDGVGNIAWTCVGSGGAVCPASGAGNIATSNITLPVNSSATFSISGTVAVTAVCNSALLNAPTADFGFTAGYSDPNPNSNFASVSTTVDCSHQNLLSNPNSLSFGSETVNKPTAALPVSLSGTDGVVITNISVTGDFSQTNNCASPLAGPASCQIQVVFAPTATGTRNGSLVIQSTSAASPTTIALIGTGTSAVPTQSSFLPLTGVDPSTTQISNALSVAGTNMLAPISVTGGKYSINGGPYTASPGTISPGAQVQVQVVASTVFSTMVTAELDIGGSTIPFNVTTRAVQPGVLNFSMSTFTVSGASSTIAVTVTRTGGTDGPLSAQVVDSLGEVLGTVSFPAGVGGSQDVALTLANAEGGGEYELMLTNVTQGATTGSVSNALLTVTAAPLKPITVTSGGGAMSTVFLMALGLLVACRRYRPRYGAVYVALSAGALAANGVRAADAGDFWSATYLGVRGGESASLLSSEYLSSHLKADGYQVQASVEHHSATGTLYAGYDLPHNLSLELAWTYLGWTRARLTGTTPVELDELLSNTAHIVRGSGDAVSLTLRYRLPISPKIGMNFRIGPYGWSTRSDVWVGNVRELRETDRGAGYTFGAGPLVTLGRHLSLGLSFDYFASTTPNRFIQETGTLVYHF